jgi:hypothetical protein
VVGTRLLCGLDHPNAYDSAKRKRFGTLETHREAEDEAIEYANQAAKCLKLRNLAEREGFEPSVQVLARTTV